MVTTLCCQNLAEGDEQGLINFSPRNFNVHVFRQPEASCFGFSSQERNVFNIEPPWIWLIFHF